MVVRYCEPLLILLARLFREPMAASSADWPPLDGGITRSVYSSNTRSVYSRNQPREKLTLGETLNTLID